VYEEMRRWDVEMKEEERERKKREEEKVSYVGRRGSQWML
jgi:hypothetical protein